MREVKLLSKEQLQNLNTKRLLAYKTRLLKVRDYKCSYGDSSCTFHKEEYPNEMNKSNPDWQETYAIVKEILNTREHVE